MRTLRLDLSPTGRGRVIVVSVLVTLGCIVLSYFVNSLGLTSMDLTHWWLRAVVTVVVPTAVAFPTMYFLMSKLRELAIAHAKLQVIASTDSLTAVLNRGAFTMLVDAYLKQARAQNEELRGALLVVDADHFKAINDRYGHDQGDAALRTIAQGIKGMLRGADIVGRIGGEEFGVFLPGADSAQAQAVAERICAAVNTAEFSPEGERQELSVSVGGAAFEKRIEFAELFRIADQRLYAAKLDGRNRVSVGDAGMFAAAA